MITHFLISVTKTFRFYALICFSLLSGHMPAQPHNPFGNALIPDMIADASIQEIDGLFYCYATTDGYDNGLNTSGPPVVWKSKDFVNRSFSGYYFPSALWQCHQFKDL